MLHRALAILGLLGIISFSAVGAHAERRVALVVGNAHYEHANTLRNPLNDAHDIATLLKSLGFEVLLGTDLDQQNLAGDIDQFARMLDGADVGLFYYAGHGVQMNGKNYLISTQAKLENEFLIPAETVELDTIMQLMESHARLNLIFLDACRNNPLADRLRQNLISAKRSVSLGRGLARVEPGSRDTLIAFAAAPGQEAADGRGRNSPFTAALLENMPKPGLEVSVMLKEVAAKVRRETDNAQRPQQLSDMSRTFYFAEPEKAAAVAPPKASPLAPDSSIELAYWNSARAANDCDSVRAYLNRFPIGLFTDLAKLSEQRLCNPARKVTVEDVVTPASSDAPPPATLPEADTKIAALPQPGAAGPEPAKQIGSEIRSNVARELQRELARVGCSDGRPDGNWGRHSRDAVREFNRYARASLDPDAPSKDALDAVQRRHGRVCPASERLPERSRNPESRAHENLPRIAREPAASKKDWRSISPNCQSPIQQGGRMCCTYDPPSGAPRIICP